MTEYYQPLMQMTSSRPKAAVNLGWGWFDQVVVHQRGSEPKVIDAAAAPLDWVQRATANRSAIAGLPLDRPRLMGILNVTPDSFSDGGQFAGLDAAISRAEKMVQDGADILDIGGESTRPGAKPVEIAEEIERTAPVIAAIREKTATPVSIDTRKASVAQAALTAGANVVNDVSAMTFDPAIADTTARANAPICLMHAQGDPATMQDDPQYENVLLDVYDFLSERVESAVEAGIAREQIIVDPGIGFGKTLDHNLALLRGLSMFHGLGCPILLGASRKKFIGTLGHVPDAADRVAGSVAVALAGVAAGVHFLRVHDTFETKQAIRLQKALV